ncbi:hypothetical protein RJP21_22970 [Paenibacillus sp. VCA1]|uniref:hypothetical protein n=1 Tax=Paenibacillus sp. VCA1 TaxID=3039148 RepID=UPI00287154B2|nr:hypothetical protein [Paenibacillus sp. VCA1]MDR9856469.1 hypothetical protein [Paenibacillus sp. VCA1]
MTAAKLILFEGIPGSGKTTTSQLLHAHFKEHGTDSIVFVEGSEHPIDLPFYAYQSMDEFEQMLSKYPLHAGWLKQKSIMEDAYALTPYQSLEPDPRDDTLLKYLRAKEFCYADHPVVPFDTFKQVFCRRFEKFAASAMKQDTVIIFESVLFQHQIHDIHRLYPEVGEPEIIDYLSMLARIIRPLNPMLFYLSQNSVKDSLEHTSKIRSKPKWAAEETIAYYVRRKRLELDAIKELPFCSVIIDNTDRDWGQMMATILHTLS